MTQDRSAPQGEAAQSEHERKVAEFEEPTGETTAEPGSTIGGAGRPTAAEDLAADRDELAEDDTSKEADG